MTHKTCFKASGRTKTTKVILLLIFFSVFLIGITSASLFQSNKVFNKNINLDLKQKQFLRENNINRFQDYGRYYIHKNGFLNLFRGDTVQSYTLLSSENSVINAWAILEVQNYRNSKLLNGLSFKGGTPKGIKISYWVNESYLIDKPIYQKVCGRKTLSINGTINKNCKNVKIRTDKIKKYKAYWKQYNNQVLPIGKYKIRIDGKLPYVNARVDWILNTGEQNQKLDQWAWWSSAWTYKREISNLNGNLSYMNISYQTNMNSDFSDLRFVDTATNGIELNYTIEKYVASTYVIIRVDNLGASSVQMYYGNSGATSTSSVSNTYFNPAHYYYLEETSGTNVVDATGSIDGTITGAINLGVTGKIGTAFDWDGTNSKYIDVVSGNYPSTQTISVWVYLHSTANQDFISSALAGSWGGLQLGIVSNTFQFSIGDGISSVLILNSAVPVTTNQWHHVVGQWKVGSPIKIYVDGSVNSGVTLGGMGTATNIRIGNYWGNTIPVNGIMDEVSFYNKVLTPTEIYNLYTQTSPSYILGSQQANVGIITLNSPIDNFNATSPTINFNASVYTINYPVANVSLIINNSYYQTNSSGLNNSNYLFPQSLSDGNYNWNYELCDNVDLCINSTKNTFTINTKPFIQFESPTNINNTSITNSYLPVNVSLTETYFKNITFNFYKGSTTTSYSFTNSTRFINESFTDGTWFYNVTTWTTTNQINSTETRTINVDTTTPNITITYPTSPISYHEANTNLQANWTVSDANLNSCWIDFNNVNTSVTCNTNTTNLNITSVNQNNFTFYANDTFGNLASKTQSWVYTIFQNSLNYTNLTIGGNYENFILNITKPSSLQILKVDFVYNSSSSSALFTSGDIPTISKSLTIPNPSTTKNFSFYYSITLSDNQIINTSAKNQTVSKLDIGDCSTYSTLVYNFTLYDEESQAKLTNVTIDYAFDLYDSSRTILLLNFSKSSTSNPTKICINQNLTSASKYSLDGTIKYVSTEGAYLLRYYNILNFSLINSTIPNNINLYNILNTVGVPFRITFRDSLLVLSPNILVNVNRQFVSSNDYKTVEIPITDTNGQTTANLVRNTGIYNFIMIDSAGNIVATFSETSVFCKDITIGECSLELDTPSTTTGSYIPSVSEGISYTLLYTNSSSIATFNFNSINSTPVTTRIIGISQNQFGNRTVCDTSMTSTLGTLQCNASSILRTDNNLFINIYSNGNYITTRVVNINPQTPLIGGQFGTNGFFIAFLMMLFIIILFSEDRQVLLIMVGFGWLIVLTFGLVKGTIIGAVSGGIWLLVSIAVMLWKLKKDEFGR